MSDPNDVQVFVSGGLSVGYLVAALFFLRFWATSKRFLFAVFATAFVLMACTQALPSLLGIPREYQSFVYLMRLVAFLLIIYGVLRHSFEPADRDDLG
jgi:hypothetical protein